MLTNDPRGCVTQHQLEVIALYASGYDYQRIADAKFVTYGAVRATLGRAQKAVGADSLTHLCTLCVEAEMLVKDGAMFMPVIDPTDMT